MAYLTGTVPNSIIQQDGVIQLKEYTDDLLFYSSFDSTLDANFYNGLKTPTTTGTTTIQSSATFGQLALLNNATVKYDKTNLTTSLTNQGTIQFRVQAFYNNARGYQEFTNTTVTVPSNANYSFRLSVNGSVTPLTIALVTADTLLSIVGKINAVIPVTASASVSGSNKIRITSINFGDAISILAPTSGNNFITLMGGVDSARMPNANTTDVDLIKIGENSNDNNRIVITHKTDSSIWLKMYTSTGVLTVNQKVHDWDNNNTTYYAFELDFNETIGQFFLDGVMKSIFQTGFLRTDSGYLTISSGTTQYKFDEVIIYDVYKNNRNFTPAASNLSKYDISRPYVDLKVDELLNQGDVIALELTASAQTTYIASIGGIYYYYFAGGWQVSNGTYSQSTELILFIEKFPELNFNGTETIIRVFLASDGNTLQYLETLNLITDITSSKPAKLTGTKDLTNPVDLSVNNKIKITTVAGSYAVNIAGATPAATTLTEIKNKINAAAIPYLAPASDDGAGHLVLFTTNTGSTALLAVDNGTTNSALSIVWGSADSLVGTEEISPFSLDYSEIFRYIRSTLGDPIVPVELTDEQLQDCVSYAVYYFNYYRNSKESLLKTILVNNGDGTFTIPTEVGGEQNIVDVIFRPGYPFSFFDGNDNFMSLVYMNWFSQNYRGNGLGSLASDYFVSMSTLQDLSNILGKNISYRFFDGKMKITPMPPGGCMVGIIFRSALTLTEINTNMLIKKLSIARAKQLLGTIRSTFGGVVPGGTENLTLRGEALIAEGKQEENDALIELQKLQEPFFLSFG